jgi:hypothetical protein
LTNAALNQGLSMSACLGNLFMQVYKLVTAGRIFGLGYLIDASENSSHSSWLSVPLIDDLQKFAYFKTLPTVGQNRNLVVARRQ